MHSKKLQAILDTLDAGLRSIEDQPTWGQGANRNDAYRTDSMLDEEPVGFYATLKTDGQ